jgi:hypothetical protein
MDVMSLSCNDSHVTLKIPSSLIYKRERERDITHHEGKCGVNDENINSQDYSTERDCSHSIKKLSTLVRRCEANVYSL